MHVTWKVLIATAAIAVMQPAARAQDSVLPPGNVHFICAFAPGGGADILVRYLAEKMRPISGRTIIVENRVGAGGNIAAEYLIRSKPDGLTVFLHSGGALASNEHLRKNPTFEAAKQIQMVAGVNRQPNMLVVRADSPVKSLAELTALMKQKGDKATYASANPTAKVVGELYKEIASLPVVEVSYKSAPDTMNDLLSGAVDYAVVDNIFALAQARQGKVRIVAISSRERMRSTPELPTLHEQGVTGLDLISWWAAMVPVGTPKLVIGQLNAWFNQVGALPETAKFFSDSGADAWSISPDDLQAFFLKEVEQWGKYVKLAKMEPQ